jgi:hypothetical protein
MAIQVKEKYEGASIEKNEYYQADPTGSRTGNGVGPQLTETIERVARDAEEVLNKVKMKTAKLGKILLTLDLLKINADRKIAVTRAILQEKLDNIRGAVTMGKLSCCTLSELAPYSIHSFSSFQRILWACLSTILYG